MLNLSKYKDFTHPTRWSFIGNVPLWTKIVGKRQFWGINAKWTIKLKYVF